VIFNRSRKRIISQVGTRDAARVHQFLDIRIQLWFNARKLPNVDFNATASYVFAPEAGFLAGVRSPEVHFLRCASTKHGIRVL